MDGQREWNVAAPREWNTGITRVKWGAIFAGLVVGMTLQMVLTLFGLAIGAWSIDLGAEEPVGSVPTGTGIWTGISMLIAAFVGGFTTAYISGTYLKSAGMMHGVVVWGANWLVVAFLMTTAVGALFGGVFSVFGSGLQALGQGISGAAGAAVQQGLPGDLQINPQQLRQRLESMLASTEKPELQPGEIRKDVGEVQGQAQEGKPVREVSQDALTRLMDRLAAFDRQAAVNVLVNEMGMSEAQAREVVSTTLMTASRITQQAGRLGASTVQLADQTIEQMGDAAMWMAVIAILTLGATIGGAAAGTPSAERLAEAQAGPARREAV